ncbi:MAG: helix-hairpin-helix domain-containing protein [Campylobacterota bacterium]|nr:helix-hairpin-helix domain-containing protein [Campylobacterota bacterium]
MKHILLIMAMVFSLMAAVNINKATKAELMSIKGIGDKKATAIIDYRKKHGKFKNINDLTQVKGLGDKSVRKISKEITVK